jgi:methionyl-tRNA formyltransferase
MRIVFAGTPAFAEKALRALVRAGHDVALVLTRPDRPAGRGMKVRIGEVKAAALQLGLPIAQPPSLRTPEVVHTLRQTHASTMIVAAYGLLLPQNVLDLFALGCINIHASLLPRWRGAAPIQRAILAGDTRTGISVMRMEAGLDTGPVLLSREIAIAGDETGASLHDRLSGLGAQCIVECLTDVERGSARAIPQPHEGVTYAPKIQKNEAIIDWTQSAQAIDRQIRAFNPYPVAATSVHGDPLKLWRSALAADVHGPAGQVLSAEVSGIVVGCGTGALRILELQRASSRRMSAAEFLRGFTLQAGERLGD